ncbi:NmrA domain-containing protein [Rhizoctonia solani AG-1 IA]|uniref:NmrA domain-containing protein n=1 Tax=Thanatephorus cucumeris (strain AG1-IA) TaxID=983506 RepID=L8X302_THACA|nr:NmrA domain-containing protein [Rhizoctonia solani AG-1 IA]
MISRVGIKATQISKKGEYPCSTCGKCDKNLDLFFVQCSICKRFWHNGMCCLYTRVPQNEIMWRNSKDPSGLGRGWRDWKCRQCRGIGPEGRENRRIRKLIPTKRLQYQISLQHILITEIDLTLEDDVVEVVHPAPTGLPARQASAPLLLSTRPEHSPRLTPAPQPQAASRESVSRGTSPEVIVLDDDDDVIEILSSAHQSPLQLATDPEPEPPIESPAVILQDVPMFDINDLSLEERPPTPPPPEFPVFAKQVDKPERRFPPTNSVLRPSLSLPPALRAGGRTPLGQKMQDAIITDKIVQSLGLRGLKAVGWRTEKRERIASIEPAILPAWARPSNDKGKDRDPRERMPRSITEVRLIPPRAQAIQVNSGSESHPSRKPRKTSAAVHRDNTVKLEPSARGSRGAIKLGSCMSTIVVCLISISAEVLRKFLRGAQVQRGDQLDGNNCSGLWQVSSYKDCVLVHVLCLALFSIMKVVLVVGATGQQGYAVIHALAESNEYLCLALTRNPESPKAQQLTSFRNVKLVSADLNDIQQLRSIFKNARSSNTGEIWGVFVALAFPGLGVSNIAIVAQEFQVQSYIYSSVIPPFMDDSPPPPGLDRHCKMVLEKHISNLNFPWTRGLRIIRPGAFMENLNPGIIGRMTYATFQHCLPAESVYTLAGRRRYWSACSSRVRRQPPARFQAIVDNILGRIEEFIQADRMRRMDPRGFDANLQEAASYLKLTSFEEWARNWNNPPDKGAKQHGITLWGLFMGNTTAARDDIDPNTEP